jgi:magnesium chelatase subunit D
MKNALELAKTYLTPSALLILLSDGRANVGLRGGDPWREALIEAQQLNCRALVIDTDRSDHSLGRISELGQVLRAPSIPLADMGSLDVLEINSHPRDKCTMCFRIGAHAHGERLQT